MTTPTKREEEGPSLLYMSYRVDNSSEKRSINCLPPVTGCIVLVPFFLSENVNTLDVVGTIGPYFKTVDTE